MFAQSDLFATPSATDWTPRSDEVRDDMIRIIDELRRADSMPWSTRKALHQRTVFPQMARWLEEKDAERLVEEFSVEFSRLSKD